MKKHKSYLLFALMAILSIISACNTEIVDPPVKWEPFVTENKSNKFDDWGRVHNEGLDFIAKNLDTTNLAGKDTNKIIFQLILDFVSAHPDPQYKDPDIQTVDQLDKAVADNDDLKNSLSIDGQNLFKDLQDQMSKFKPLMDIKAFQSEIINIENKFSSANISTQDQEALLKSGSIARYSSAYWYAEFKKINDKNDLGASIWQKKLDLLYPDKQINNARSYNAAEKDPGGNKMPDAIGSSSKRPR